MAAQKVLRDGSTLKVGVFVSNFFGLSFESLFVADLFLLPSSSSGFVCVVSPDRP
jgi:hypothetical protein